MNYLAHLFLAGSDEGLIIGNFIADSIRGKEMFLYSEAIQNGIKLHRKIDQFTDSHPVVKQTTLRLRNSAGKYAPVVTDIVYDHFLAANWSKYSSESLQDFAQKKYQFLNSNLKDLPLKMHELFYVMKEQNWLVNYADIKGIAKTLAELSTKVNFANTLATSILDLEKDYESFQSDFFKFFPDIQEYVKREIQLFSL
ncbi:MAG: DUF479 domain-containing protein [Opitutaceae bacterium]|nr:DUF479 domain-containing protein [Cytophagales bacterium]